MKGWIAIKSFKHRKQHLIGDIITEEDVHPMYYDTLEKKGLIRWIERPKIIMPKEERKPLHHTIPKTTARKSKKNVHKSKK